MRHIIQKQLIELDLKSRDDIFVIQQKASDYYHRYILPTLSKIFDDLSNENEVIRINRLEIDLGLIHWDKPVGEFKIDGIYDILKKEIETQLKISGNSSRHQNLESAATKNLSREPVTLNAGRQWLYYMQHGILSWNAPVVNNAWRIMVLEALATEFALVTILRKLIKEDRRALSRMVYDHDEPLLTAKEQTALPQAVSELKLIYIAAGRIRKAAGLQEQRGLKPFKIWHEILQDAAGKPGGSTSLQIAESLLANAAENGEIDYADLSLVKKQLDLLKPAVTKMLKKMTGAISEQIIKSQLQIDGDLNDSPVLKTNLRSQQEKEKKTDQVPVKQSKKDKKKSAIQEDGPESLPQHNIVQPVEMDMPVVADFSKTLPEEGLFVEYAGLVLLHPFFRFLFKNIGLTEEGSFISREKQEKAILLLYYLATGHTDAEDHLLAVPKILCCWPLDEPLESNPELNEQEKIEANDLIFAAIAQWTIIKNTSAEGLREGFLHRPGKIFLKNDNVYIQVEKSGIDILLDQLPWNLSIIKLPWIKELIRVEWR